MLLKIANQKIAKVYQLRKLKTSSKMRLPPHKNLERFFRYRSETMNVNVHFNVTVPSVGDIWVQKN